MVLKKEDFFLTKTRTNVTEFVGQDLLDFLENLIGLFESSKVKKGRKRVNVGERVVSFFIACFPHLFRQPVRF